MTTQIWTKDPTVLLNKDSIFELWPTSSMCFEAKINSITRLILFLSILGFLVTGKIRVILIGLGTIAAIAILYSNRKSKLIDEVIPMEGFENNSGDNLNKSSKGGEKIINPENLEEFVKDEFKIGDKKNPFSNVLLPEISYDPHRKSAPPAFNVDIDEDIRKNTKRMVQYLNPGIKNTNKQLFSSLTDNFDLDNSLRVWNATPNTRIANDQSAFAQFLYGDMYSAKQSDAEGAMMRVKDNIRYTLY